MNIDARLKLKVQTVMLLVSLSLLILKFTAFFITNSVGILTDAMESIVNVVAGSITLYAIYYAAKPRDPGHPFGHGKFELISASIEGIMVCVAGVLII
ncbi:MAG: cation transporter, partial [Rikenellaceae bacterium]